MRPRFLLVVASVGLAVSVFTPVASAQSPRGDSVTGRATACAAMVPFCFHPTFVDLDAHSGPGGENPTGTAAFGDQPGSGVFLGDEGPVGCLNVSGSTAIVGFSGAPGINRTLIRVIDSGSLPGQDSFVIIGQGRVGEGPPVPPPDCSTFPPTPAGDASVTLSGKNDLGDVVVHDAPPPTTYTQCRQGGWAQYGYASHPDCIDTVHQLARRKCIFERVSQGVTAFRAKYGLGPNDDHAMRHCVRLYTGF